MTVMAQMWNKKHYLDYLKMTQECRSLAAMLWGFSDLKTFSIMCVSDICKLDIRHFYQTRNQNQIPYPFLNLNLVEEVQQNYFQNVQSMQLYGIKLSKQQNRFVTPIRKRYLGCDDVCWRLWNQWRQPLPGIARLLELTVASPGELLFHHYFTFMTLLERMI